jgi:alkylation response protein AidB-like acyl-CoA dehydrogenase
MMIDTDAARFITYEAAWRLSQNLPASKEVSMAKAFVSEASRRVTLLGHSIFGAIGFTKDHDMQLYYRRSKAAALNFGNTDYHHELVAQELKL